MIPERWAKLKDLFHGALAHAPHDRAAFLLSSCADDSALRREIERLLEAHERAVGFMEQPPIASIANTTSEREDLNGRTLGHYALIRSLGVGGMGQVYLARDTTLGRQVALKVVADSDPHGQARLRREAQHASQLNHPHICTIHEVGDANGRPFIVMEFVEGRLLKELIPPGGLPIETALRYAIEIADGLAHAHEHGIVHRDLKSSNVIVTTDGRVKLLDFGLARRVLPDKTMVDEQSVTEVGTIAGTIDYLAPEVLRGKEADARSDVWAFGVLLYELVAGRRPFDQATTFERTSAILRESPAPLAPIVPLGIRAVVERCLAKEPERRYTDGKALKEALGTNDRIGLVKPSRPGRAGAWVRGRLRSRAMVAAVVMVAAIGVTAGSAWWRTLDRAPNIQSVAVLPLENLSGDRGQDYFADGLTEELITDLAKISGLKVISRTSVMQYKGTKKPARQIARELNVDGIIESSVLRSGNRVRVTVQLIDGRADTHVWAERYERDMKDVLVLQHEIAQSIARAVDVTLTPQETTRLTSARSIDPEAHEAYLEGRYLWNQRTVESLTKAPAYFQRAIEREPTYVAAYAGLADAYYILGDNGYRPPRDVFPLARAAALKALEFDPNSAEAHTSLGTLLADDDWDWLGAEREFKTALALNPNYALAHHYYGVLLQRVGRLDEAIDEATRAQRLDPLAPRARTNLAWDLYFDRRYDESIRILQDALAIEPNQFWTHALLGLNYSVKGMHQRAVDHIRQAGDLGQAEGQNRVWLGVTYAHWGKKDLARDSLDRVLELARNQYVPPALVGLLCSVLGSTDQAFEWLERASEARDPWLTRLVLREPGFEPIRADARFGNLVHRLALSP